MADSRRTADGVFDEPAFVGVRDGGAGHDVFDEPAVFPSRSAEPATVAGTADEIWEEPNAPTPPTTVEGATHRERIAAAWHAAEASMVRRGMALIGLIMLSGVLAIVCALLRESFGRGVFVFATVVFAPVIEELAKSFGVLVTLERRPWLLGSSGSLFLVNGISGLVFAVIENLMYLNCYIKEPTAGTILVRWFGCTALHVGCCLVSAVGFARAWREAAANRSTARLGLARPWLVAAMVLHGLWNLVATLCGLMMR